MTRRDWFKCAAAAPALLYAAEARDNPASPAGDAQAFRRLGQNWEHYRGSLGGIWEVWRGNAAAANVTWDKVGMPHCFNAWDAVDPDRPYYQGPGWYRVN